MKKSCSQIIKMNCSENDTSENTPKEGSYEEGMAVCENFKEFRFKSSNKNDDHRHHLAHKDGGLTCDDPKQIDKLRSVGK